MYLCFNKFIHNLSIFSGSENNPKRDQLIQCIKLDIGILSYKQWLDKTEDLKTMLNIPPFTLTGDINDAVFPMLNEALKNSYLLCSLPEHSSIPMDSDSLAEEDSTPTVHRSSTPKQQKSATYKSKLDEINSPKNPDGLAKENSTTTSHRSSTSKQRKTAIDKSKTDEINSPRSSSVSRTTSKSSSKKNKKKTTEWKYIPKKTRLMYSCSESDKLEFQTKFAEQMQKNEEEFQKILL